MITDAGIPVVSVATKFTIAPHCPSVLLTVIFGGQIICDANPVTVTVNEHSAVKPAPSVTLWVTVVVPIGNVDPLAKPAVLIVVDEQLSVPIGVV